MSDPSFLLTPGPHLHEGLSTRQIMWWVTISLIPAFAWATWIFGINVVYVTTASMAGAMMAEWVTTLLRRQRPSLKDGSAALTGLLLAATLSPGISPWIAAIGGFAAIMFAKSLFGGLGYNIFNPALIGRAFLMASFPVAMTTTWQAPQMGHIFNIDAITTATPLNHLKLTGQIDVITSHLIFGLRAGSIGEVSIVLILLGALILLSKRIISLYIPLSVIVGLWLVSLFSGHPLFHLLTGGLWIGAFYMATDYVTAPMMPKGQIIFGIGIGLLTGIIRIWGGYPEGICYAILIMNAVTPALNQWFKPARPSWEGVLS